MNSGSGFSASLLLIRVGFADQFADQLKTTDYPRSKIIETTYTKLP